jgi:hypothetical protein
LYSNSNFQELSFIFLKRQGILKSEMLAGEQTYNGVFTLDVKSMLNENLGGILGGTQC